MKRFLTLMGITMQSRMVYRASFLIGLMTPLVLLFGQFLLWNALYAGNGGAALGGYAKPDMLSYLLIAFFINNLLTWSSENALSREIRSGMVIARRLRPVSFLTQSLSEMMGNMLLQAAVNLAIVAGAFGLFPSALAAPAPGRLLLFLPSFLLAMLLRMLLVHCFSLLCFFTTGHLGITWTRTALTEFFSGALIPVALFPAWLKSVAYVLPFPLMLQVPAGLLLGRPLDLPVPLTFLLQAAWILIFLGLHSLLYGYIRKNTTLAGG